MSLYMWNSRHIISILYRYSPRISDSDTKEKEVLENFSYIKRLLENIFSIQYIYGKLFFCHKLLVFLYPNIGVVVRYLYTYSRGLRHLDTETVFKAINHIVYKIIIRYKLKTLQKGCYNILYVSTL